MSKAAPFDMATFLRFDTVDKKTFFYQVSTIFAAASIVYIVGKCIYNRYFHPLRHFPGPVAASLTEFYLPWSFYFGVAEHVTDEQRHARYGSITRKAPNVLQIDDPELLPVFNNRTTHKPKRVYYSPAWGVGDVPTILNQLHPKEHQVARKRLTPAFIGTAVKKMQPLMQKRVDEWIEKSWEYANEGTAIDWSKWTQSLAYDVITELVFGAPIGFVKTKTDVYGVLQQFKQATPYIGILNRLPWLVEAIWKSPLGSYLIPAADTPLGKIFSVRDRLLQERLDKSVDKPDILSVLLKGVNEDGSPVSLDVIKSESFILMAAGSETTFSVMCSFTINIIQHPRVYKKIMETDLSPENLAQEDPQFPYLYLAIKESMRLMHPAPSFFPRLVGKGGVTLKDGRFIPEGSEVAMNPYCVLRSKKIFGDDADQFRPERWIDSPPEQLALMETYNPIWSYGRTSCPGKPVAEMELLMAFRALLLNFVPEFANPEKPWDHITNYGSLVYEGLYIKLKPRVA
ncbi:cytochrome P450 [Sphaerosporella brunnea]|uniref:Cytochrome P450 n=1 Tax=Sphaerosporella brunnea TaxID=1250544 RepID=A0A5J5EEV4_9PEZI|nr:cytochrome P450 [Sphaerosporella brunnea]